jgi:hypothetical protein
MGIIGLSVTILCYGVAAYDSYKKGRIGLSVVFISYAIANIAFIYELHKSSGEI